MAIKVGEKDLFPYLGDYGPVNIYKGEQKLAGYKWAEKSGQELHFDNTYNSHVDVEVDGQSYQRFDPNARNMAPTKYEDWLVDHDYNRGEGALEVHSNRMAASWLIEVEPNKSYYYDTGNPDVWYVIRTLDSNKTIENESWGGSGASGVKTTNSTTKYLGVALYTIRSGLILKDEFQAGNIKPIIQDASVTDRSFIEYVPKAPSPDYPIEIHNVNDFDVVSSVGRNLFDIGKVSPSEYTTNPDGTYTFRKTSGFYTSIFTGGAGRTNSVPDVSKIIKLEVGEKYTASITLHEASRTGFTISGINSSGDMVEEYGRFRDNELSLTFTANHPYLDIRNITDGDYIVSDIQIKKGNKATPYIPEPEDITPDTDHPLIDKINLSLSEPLRSVGDVKDRLFKDSDGLWKVERNVGEMVFDGTENWGIWYQRDTSGVFGLRSRHLEEPMLKTNGLIASNMFPSIDSRDEEGVYTVTEPRLRVRTFYERIGTTLEATDDEKINSFKQWLSSVYTEGVPLTIVYELETPTTETLDQELQHQLNTLKSFKGSNYVYTVLQDDLHKEQLKPTLHATFNSKDYLKETRTLTNLLIWARELTDEELIHHNQLFLNRFNLPSDRVIGEPIEQTLNLLHGGMIGHSLEQNYTINI